LVKSQHHVHRNIAGCVIQLRPEAAQPAAPGNRPRIGLFAKDGIVRDRAWQGDRLDVFSQEPIDDDAMLRQLLAHERVIATKVARNIISALRGDTLFGVSTLPFSPTMSA
jgi:hypothetical protein